MNLPDEPLKAAEVEELGDLLLSDDMPQNRMVLEALQGFLTALAIGPAEVLPGEWMPVIWGNRGKRFVFRSRERGYACRVWCSVCTTTSGDTSCCN